MIRALLAVAVLTLVYLFALASFDPWDVAFGVVVGAGALALGRRLGTPGRRGSRASTVELAVGIARLAAALVRDILVGTWQVTLVVLHVRPLEAPGIVAIPLGERSVSGALVQGFLTTLAPGEFLVDVDEERGVMLVHVIDARDPDEIRRRYDDLYDRAQRAVAP